MKVSVCLAAYRGERYLEAQVRSILPQLCEGDELLISDDAPGGETERIACALAQEDARIRLLRGPGEGVVRNFEFLLGEAAGEVIFLSDQDDVWLPGKREAVLREIGRGAVLVLHDAALTDAELHVTDRSFFACRQSTPGFWHNVMRNSFMGCCMAFRREVLECALPFPRGIPMHDQWIGLAAYRKGEVRFLPEALILHRQHGENVTGGRTTLAQKLFWRVSLMCALPALLRHRGV